MQAATVDAVKKPARSAAPRAAKRAAADRPTAWAQAVIAGRVIAGPGVRSAAARHLRDLAEAKARGYTYNLPAALEAIAFFEEVLCLNGGAFEGARFKLLGWQAFIVGSVYGWKRADGTRRFRNAYVETGKGSGKSPLAAGIGLHGLTADGEARAEVYAAATKKDQAMILFRDAVAMYDQSPELIKRLSRSGVGEKTWNLAYHATSSFFRPIAADQGQSGPRPHIFLVDELHEHPTNYVIEMGRAGFKSRRQPLLFAITNSGHDMTSPCGQYHDYALQVAAGTIQDDAFFGFVCNLDATDDPFEDEACWFKANPSLQEANLPGVDYLRQQVLEARGLPSKQAIVRRLNFCQWTQSEAPWLSPTVWMPAARSFSLQQFAGRRAYAGLDLSSTTDLTALTVLIEPAEAGEPWHVLPFAWVPEQNLEQRERDDKVPYTQWVRDAHLLTTPGAVISKLAVLRRLSALCETLDMQAVAYDRWRIEDLRSLANDAGITLPTMVEFGQGYKDMAPAIENFEAKLKGGELVHNSHPVLTWCAANAVVVEDDAGNRKLSKRKATGRIDCVLAAVMAVGIARSPDEVDIDEFISGMLST
jgi:phage terminase large subunit-like protein